MTLHVTTHDAFASVAPGVAALAEDAAGLYTGSRWLALEEDAHPGGHFYVSAVGSPHVRCEAAVGAGHDSGDPGAGGRGLLPCYRFDDMSNPWPAARVDLFAAEFAGLDNTGGELDALLPSVVVGGRRPGHTQVLTSPGADRAAVCSQLVVAAAREAAARGAASLAALYVDADDADLNRAFSEAGAVELASPANMTLDLPGTGVDDWLAALGRKRRGNVLADRRKLEAAGVELTVRPLTAADVEDVVELEMRNYRKYGHDYDPREARALHESYLRHLDGSSAYVSQARRAGRLLGFASLVRHGDTVYARQAGFDAARSEDLPVYMGVVFDAPVAWAYRHGIRRIDLSISAEKTKERKGASAQPRRAWVLPLRGQSIRSLDAAR